MQNSAFQSELASLKMAAERGERDPLEVAEQILHDLDADLDSSIVDNSENLAQLDEILGSERGAHELTRNGNH